MLLLCAFVLTVSCRHVFASFLNRLAEDDVFSSSSELPTTLSSWTTCHISDAGRSNDIRLGVSTLASEFSQDKLQELLTSCCVFLGHGGEIEMYQHPNPKQSPHVNCKCRFSAPKMRCAKDLHDLIFCTLTLQWNTFSSFSVNFKRWHWTNCSVTSLIV